LNCIGSRHATRNTIFERPPAPAQDRSQRSCQRYRLGHGRDAGTPLDVAREPSGRVAPVAHAKHPWPKSAQGCGFAGVLLWAQTVVGPVERNFTHVDHPSAAATASSTTPTVLRKSASTTAAATAVDGRTTAASTPSAFLSSKPAAYRCRISTTHRKTVPRDGQQRVIGHRRGRASTATNGLRDCQTLTSTRNPYA